MRIIEVGLDMLELKYEKLRSRSPVREKGLLVSLEESGQQQPIIALRCDGTGTYTVIDGHKRVRALRKIKTDTVKAVVWEIPLPEALLHIYRMQSGSGYNPLEEGWLIQELCRSSGWTLTQAAQALNRSKGWASRRLGLVESLPETVLDGVQRGKIGAYAAMKYLLPLARANAGSCEALAKAIMEHDLTSRQAEILWRALSQAPKAQVKNIMEDPMLFLKAKETAALNVQDPRLTALENRCFNNLKIIGNISLGLARSLPEALGYDVAEAAKDRIYQGWTSAWERLKLLEKTGESLFTKEPAHAR